MVADALHRADINTARQEKPVRIAPTRTYGGDLIDARSERVGRQSSDSDATRFNSSSTRNSGVEPANPHDKLGINEGEDPNLVDWYGPGQCSITC